MMDKNVEENVNKKRFTFGIVVFCFGVFLSIVEGVKLCNRAKPCSNEVSNVS